MGSQPSRRIGKKLFLFTVVALVATLALPALALAQPADQGPAPFTPSFNPPLGIVPVHGQASTNRSGGSNLSYHGGPVMQTNAVYAIYWIPAGYSVSSGYQSVINGFFTNVAADNGATSNVYYSDTQYYGPTGANIAYTSSVAGAVVDTNPLPASGCTDSATPVCLSDAQIQAEIQKVMTANGWTGGPTKLFFMFTAKNIGSCAGSSCAFTQYCAYHSNFAAAGTTVLYANMPYAMTAPSACGSGQSPNADDADSTINVASHEHNEAITDAQGSAWYDRRGYENGDKCAWNFGTASGPAGAEYNQVIHGAHYYLQQEWSNKSSACVLTGQ